ncbi:unnamed protein product [Vicia faba]|uniref:Aldehyde dehydrogenase n=1 Tax=Vicia faba TaxID=3906 RepID=A0AAV0YGY3_VICFA|nr:unnamed protein product [Vicia faba]
MEFSVEALEEDLNNMRKYYGSGKTKETSWRKSQLNGLRNFVIENEEKILKALKKDLGKHHVEAFRDEVGILKKSIDLAIKSFKQWMNGKEAKLPQIALLSSAEIVAEPLGLVLIISSWNFPFGLSLEPLIGAVAAGNTIVLKPSEMAPVSSSLLATVLPNYLDINGIKIIEGGPEVGEILLQQKWNKIFFTGNARVGRLVMSAAVENLTPVTLELGGKCPALVDSLSNWDREVAVKRILGAKYGSCAGQACIAIDYVLVEKRFSSTLIELMKERIKKMYGDDPKGSNTIARIVNKHHYNRIKGFLNDPIVKESVVFGGSMEDDDELFIEPTILLDPPLESAIMTEEIFGPILPIIIVEKIEDSIEFINSKPKPLAIYAFTKNKTLQRRLVSETSSGSIVFNDAILQYAGDTIPFGGVGESGFGKYHGKFSFDEFSHYKAVVRRSYYSDFWFRFPPWNLNKFQLLEEAYNLNYIGIVLVVLGLKRSKRSLYQACSN